MQTLRTQDLLALGFMTFALFLGAGNIIFPPMVGLAAGSQLWPSALGFLLTGVGLPLLTVVAVARAGGGLAALTAPIGRHAGTLLAIVVYLAIGPLFATPRTATVSFEMGLAPFTGYNPTAQTLYVVIYFALVLLVSLYPGRLIDTLGRYLTPLLIVALALLGGAAIWLPAGSAELPPPMAPLAQGFVQGYQTMDALAALVFGIVIVDALRSQHIHDRRLQTRYTIVATLIAALGLGLVYLSLIYLGATSGALAPDARSGVPLLTGYVAHTFGRHGALLLSVVIVLACFTTAVGLVCACAAYFSQLLKLPYPLLALLLSLFSAAAATLGLEQLLAVSGPVLTGLYPIAIALVALSLLQRQWRSPPRVYVPTLLAAAAFGLLEGLHAAGLNRLVPDWSRSLPASDAQLGWVLPVLLTALLAALADRARPLAPAQPRG